MAIEGTLSLKDLKAENEKEAKQPEPAKEVELEEDDNPVDPPEEPVEDPADEDDDPEPDADSEDEDSDDDADDKGQKKPEPWMESDADEDDPVAKAGLSDSEAAKIRRKYKAQAQEAKDELEQYKKRVKELEEGKVEHKTENRNRPKRDDFDDEEKYIEALADYTVQQRLEKSESKEIAERQKAARQQALQHRTKAVDEHYTRAHILSEKSGIKPEKYQSADMRVREAVEEVFPDAGDEITDHMISLVGEGSEKVFYHLGVNAKRREEFLERLKADTSGLKAAVYLGKLNTELSGTVRRPSKAPDPGVNIQGDKQANAGVTTLRKKYDEAHRKGDIQKAFEIKRQAKKKGYNTSEWTR